MKEPKIKLVDVEFTAAFEPSGRIMPGDRFKLPIKILKKKKRSMIR